MQLHPAVHDCAQTVRLNLLLAFQNLFDEKDSVISSVNVKANSAFAPPGVQLKLRVSLLETLHFTTAPGSNSEKDFEHVVRRMYPGAALTALPTSWTTNQTQTFTVKGPVPSFMNKNNEVLIAVWIQNDAETKPIRVVRNILRKFHRTGSILFWTSAWGIRSRTTDRTAQGSDLMAKLRNPHNGLGDIYQLDVGALNMRK